MLTYFTPDALALADLLARAILYINCLAFGWLLADTLEAGARKVGGIWFFRAWRVRASFCIARA